MKFKPYFELIKPGIVRANVLTAAAAYLFASAGNLSLIDFIGTLAGIALVIASGCVLNNIMDVSIDSKMDRTRNRPLVTGKVSVDIARKFAYVLGISGLVLILIFANLLTAILGIIAIVTYVYIYGWAKRQTKFATSIGTIPGGASIVAGYTAASGRPDSTAFTLFLLMVTWQMAHFLSITLFRSHEYESAGISVLPQRMGKEVTQRRIMFYMLSFSVSGILYMIFAHPGMLNAFIIVGSGLLWLYIALLHYKQIDAGVWGKKMFRYSLIVLLIMCLSIALDGLLA